SPSLATAPLTVTRPSAIHSSAVRRLARPAWAIIFCKRSGDDMSQLLALPHGNADFVGMEVANIAGHGELSQARSWLGWTVSMRAGTQLSSLNLPAISSSSLELSSIDAPAASSA